MTTTTLYGIPNCDSVRKARKWLDQHHVEYVFTDLRATLPSAERVCDWLRAVGTKQLLNKRSTTWKQLTDAEREQAEGDDTVEVLLQYPTLIKRPVLEHDGTVTVGFQADDYTQRFIQ